MVKNSKYTYLDELERSQQLDRINAMGDEERRTRNGQRPRRDAEGFEADADRERRMRERRRDIERKEREERRKKKVKTIRIILVVALIAIVGAVIFFARGIFGKGSGPTPEQPPVSFITPEPTVSSTAPVVEGTPTPTPEPEAPTMTPTPTPEPVLAWWEYYSEEPIPEGDIVQVNSQIYSYEQMCRDLNFLRQRYPDKLQVYRIGKTADDRELLDCVIGSENATKDVIIQYSMHAREYINTPLAMRQIEEFLKNWDTPTYNGKTCGSLVNNVRLHLIPMANPDGIAISQGGFEAIRNEEMRAKLNDIWQYDQQNGYGSADYETYYKRWKANGRGVDLNRNFDQNWETTGGRSWYSSSGYAGESAASENETKAIVRLANAINCIGEVAYHSMGSIVYWDYGTTGDLHAKDEKLANVVADLTGYALNSTIDTGQNSSGCSDYFILERGVPAITIETGKETCPVPIEQWPDIWERNRYIVPALAELFGGF